MPDARAKFRLEGENATGAAFAQAIAGAQGAATKMQGIFKAAFAGISVAGFAAMINRSIEMGDELNKAAVKAGLSGKAISELAYAAKMADIDIASLSNALRFMQTNLSEAATGGKEQKLALDALGVTFANLKRLKPDQQFELLADRISELKDPADRSRAATELFGKAGADLLPMFEQGAEGIRKARQEAEKLGLVYSDESLAKLSAADDAWKRLKSTWDGLTNTIAIRLSPALSNLMDDLTAQLSGDKVAKLKASIEYIKRQIDAGGPNTDLYRKRLAEQEAALSQADGSARRGTIERLDFFTPTARRYGAADPNAPPGYGAADAAQKSAEELGKTWKKMQEDLRKENVDTNEMIQKAWEDTTQAQGDLLGGWNETFQQTMDEMQAGWNQMAENMKHPVLEAVDVVRDGMKSAFEDLIDYGHFSFKKLSQFIIAELAKKAIFKAIDDIGDAIASALSRKSGSGSTAGNIIGGVLGAIFGGGKAEGGPLESGKWYVAGEHGPEPIWGGGPGAYAMGYGRGGPSVTIVNQIDARGATQDLIAQLPAVLRANNESVKSDILDTLNRRKFAFSR